MRKIIAASLIIIVLLLGACTQESAEDTSKDIKNPISISLWHYYNGENREALEKAISKFNEGPGIENGVIVNSVAKGNTLDLEKAIKNSALGLVDSEPMPDMFSAYPDTALEIDGMNMLCDLNEYFTQEEKEIFVDVYVKDGVFRDDAFSLVPIAKSIELLYVNDTVFQEFAAESGVSLADLDTWEGIYNTSAKYFQYTDEKTPDVAGDGKSMMGFDSSANFIIAASKQLGLDIIDADSGLAMIDKKVLKPLFDNFIKGYGLGYYGKESKFRTDDIKTGRIIAYVGSSSGAVYFPTSIEKEGKYIEVNLKCLPYPKFASGERYAIRQGAGMCVSKTDDTRQKAAVLFLKWFSALDQNLDFVGKSGYLPVNKSAYEDKIFDNINEDTNIDEAKKKIVTEVYDVTIDELRNNHTYSARPFMGSYEIRNILGSTLENEVEYSIAKLEELKESGIHSEEELLKALDVDAAFEAWIEELELKLKKANVDYKIID